MVGHGFRRMWEDSEINVRNSSHGSLCLKTHSQMQETIDLSSGESELYDGIEDLGLEVEFQVNTDSSAARSISCRRGAGRFRHVEVREL